MKFKEDGPFVTPEAASQKIDLIATLLILTQLRLVAQHSVQQRTVDFDVRVVADQAKLSELVHSSRRCASPRTRYTKSV